MTAFARPSPLQNRVLPTGEIVATGARGSWTGNRGILHDTDHHLGRARWRHKAWICCTLDWQGRKRDVMSGRRWTELFFLDEATALAAGHRPCAYCRRSDYNRFAGAWAAAFDERPRAAGMDAVLHAARIGPDRRQRRDEVAAEELTDGCFVWLDGQSWLLRDSALWAYSPTGYHGPPRALPRRVLALTPEPLRAVLRAGYVPQMAPLPDG